MTTDKDAALRERVRKIALEHFGESCKDLADALAFKLFPEPASTPEPPRVELNGGAYATWDGEEFRIGGLVKHQWQTHHPTKVVWYHVADASKHLAKIAELMALRGGDERDAQIAALKNNLRFAQDEVERLASENAMYDDAVSSYQADIRTLKGQGEPCARQCKNNANFCEGESAIVSAVATPALDLERVEALVNAAVPSLTYLYDPMYLEGATEDLDNAYTNVSDALATITQLVTALRSARQDAKRLDWLTDACTNDAAGPPNVWQRIYWLPVLDKRFTTEAERDAYTFRQAIDDAITEEAGR